MEGGLGRAVSNGHSSTDNNRSSSSEWRSPSLDLALLTMEAFFEREPRRNEREPSRHTVPLPQQTQQQSHQQNQPDDEVDPLDAFMADLNETLVREKAEFEEKQRREQAGETQESQKERFFDDDDIAAESIEHLNTQKTLAVSLPRGN